jgi:ring-1,2-phenylacetyl-CoA epoxidase subunit PaaC
MSTDALVERPLPESSLRPEAAAALLALADDELVMGHRHSQWLGLSPFLEEDLTMASIAQDEMGHARALYACIWPDWVEREADVVRRRESEWRSGQLVELAAPSWEWALIRHWVYDTLEPLRWSSIEASFGREIKGFAALAAKVAHEERFHRHHAEQLVIKLGLANAEANARLQRCVDVVVPLAATLVEPDQMETAWGLLGPVAAKAQLQLPVVSTVAGAASSSSVGLANRLVRHADFSEVRTALLAVVSVDPSATW